MPKGKGLLAALAAVCAAPAFAQPVDLGAFRIDPTEVTVQAFAAFAEETGLVTQATREGGGFEWGAGWQRRPGWTFRTPYGAPAAGTEPAVHVSWQEARDFCAHAGGRLPTREEWATAAYTETRTDPPQGFETGRTYLYPVGETPGAMHVNGARHVPVATTDPGVNGLFDMGGNAWEWLADRRDEDALTAGGSWWYGPAQTKAGGMQWKPATFYAVYVGFRCAYDPG
ncbi:formylglycine-generating enzyme family protein [Roseovarius aestuariivivens]|uniref:formylglycine-generating enzyme family protein n=1 Tax=Roseovarius aestuariivivens TaxID=1888910 RepID=UPI001AEBEA83|nr:formylglycine-generating enzyme family protein [Roseovarius aestuariivivens]